MKFRSRSFLLLAAVALVFFAGASIYVNAQFGAVDLAGEVLVGERSAAEGITVHERDVLYSRVEFSASYDAGSGESRSDGGLISGYDGSVPVTWGDPALGAEAVRLTSGVLTWEGPEPDFDAFEPWEREIYSDIVSSFPGGEGSFSGRVLLNDYTDTTPVRLSGLNRALPCKLHVPRRAQRPAPGGAAARRQHRGRPGRRQRLLCPGGRLRGVRAGRLHGRLGLLHCLGDGPARQRAGGARAEHSDRLSHEARADRPRGLPLHIPHVQI